MTQNQIMTYAAAAFAGFALWYITRKPGNAAAAQPAQQARDAGLQVWLDTNRFQFDEMVKTTYFLPPLQTL